MENIGVERQMELGENTASIFGSAKDVKSPSASISIFREERKKNMKKLNDHVPDIELCKEWEAKGGMQNTEFYYNERASGRFALAHYPSVLDSLIPPGGKSYAAPTEGELIDWLPAEIKKGYLLEILKHPNGDYSVCYYNSELGASLGRVCIDRSLANALMRMALELEEKK
jgi:hypothetical protein